MITGLAKLLPWRDSTIVRTATEYTDTDTEETESLEVGIHCFAFQHVTTCKQSKALKGKHANSAKSAE